MRTYVYSVGKESSVMLAIAVFSLFVEWVGEVVGFESIVIVAS